MDQEGSIWWIVKNVGDDKNGEKAWREFEKMTADGNEENWMSGSEESRGVLGETPLHMAVLFANPDVESPQGSKQFKMIERLWDKYKALRTCIYTKEVYYGENVLHIAIVKKMHKKVLQLFVESSEGAELMNHRATGSFFRVPAHPAAAGKDDQDKETKVCHYGEFALAFAACTNQKETFKYLVEKGADLRMVTEQGQHNLLHMLVLHSGHTNLGGESAEGESWQTQEDKEAVRC